MSTKFLLRSFAGGEITPELAGRLDLTKYQTGLALARNFITLPHGPAARRPGFEFIIESKNSTQPVRLIPFTFSAEQTAVIEFGHLYVRFHVGGDTLLEPGKTVASIAGSTVNTTTSHGYANGDQVFIGVWDGTKFTSGRYHKVTVVDADTFTTTDLRGVASTAAGNTSARVYTVVTPYIGADLFDLHYTQSADVITITHPSYATRELKRLGATNWTLTTLSFAAPTNAPTTLTVTATVAENENKTTQKYVVTTVGADGVTESLPSSPKAVSNNLTLAGNYNTLAWSAVGAATRYNVYKLRGGIYGYIGQARPNTGAATKTISTIDRPGAGDKTVTVTTSAAHGFSNENLVLIEATGVTSLNGAWVITVTGATTFTYESVTDSADSAATGTVSIPALSIVDDNVLPDTSQSPPEDIIALNSGTGDFPAATTYHEQRRWFAGTNDKPQVLFATRTGTESNLTSSIPSREADGMELRIASSQYNKIRHLVALSDLIAFTAGGEFRIYSDNAPAITPTSVTIKPQGYAGASNVQPVVTTGSILYVQAQGSRIRELSYSWEANSYRTVDASIMAPHRFNGFSVAELAYSRAPDSIAWAVRDDGTLLGLTYVPDQQVYGWHAHDTDGQFESVCVVPENNEDVLYAVVRRTIGANQLRYIERLHTRMLVDLEDAFFVDSGLTYSGAPATTISGLTHLEGKTVDILADGAVEARQVVTGGQVVLGTPASLVHIGLPITADLRTLPLAMEGAQAAGQGTVKNVNKVHLRVSQSSVIKAGPSFDRLREYPARAVSDPYGSPPALRDGELALTIDPSWNQDAALCVRQDLPLPLTVLSMTLEIQSGG
jgi:hypothetical protein